MKRNSLKLLAAAAAALLTGCARRASFAEGAGWFHRPAPATVLLFLFLLMLVREATRTRTAASWIASPPRPSPRTTEELHS